MLNDNKISLDDYNEMKSRFEGIKEELLVKLRQIKSIKRNFERYLESGINFFLISGNSIIMRILIPNSK